MIYDRSIESFDWVDEIQMSEAIIRGIDSITQSIRWCTHNYMLNVLCGLPVQSIDCGSCSGHRLLVPFGSPHVRGSTELSFDGTKVHMRYKQHYTQRSAQYEHALHLSPYFKQYYVEIVLVSVVSIYFVLVLN